MEQIRSILRETKEDLLTADVFGALKYLPRTPYLKAVLKDIALKNTGTDDFRKCLSRESFKIDSLKFTFWPSYPNPSHFPGSTTEPDVQLHDSNFLIFVEAKLHSGFGQLQIERELAVGLEEAGDREFFLLVVTPGISPPRIRYGGGKMTIRDYLQRSTSNSEIPGLISEKLATNAHRVLWTSWNSIISTLESAHKAQRRMMGKDTAEIRRAGDIIGDLNELMLMRGFQPFNGFINILQGRPAVKTRRRFLPGIPPEQVPKKALKLINLHRLRSLRPLSLKDDIIWNSIQKPLFLGLSLNALSEIRSVNSIPNRYFLKYSSSRRVTGNRLDLQQVVRKYRPDSESFRPISRLGRRSGRKNSPALFSVVNNRFVGKGYPKLFPWEVNI